MRGDAPPTALFAAQIRAAPPCGVPPQRPGSRLTKHSLRISSILEANAEKTNMSNETTELWDKLLAHRKDSAGSERSETTAGTEDRLKSYLETEKARTKSGEINLKTGGPETSASARRPDPVLRGKLADYLGNQDGRRQFESIDLSGKRTDPWVIDDAQKRAAIALSLILTSHLARFAGTGIGTRAINDARDEALRSIEGRDAVRLDIEAYELLNWFAAAIDPQWQENAARHSEIVKASASEDLLNRILERSIREKIDLKMRYYTGSRGEFSERIITPIAISAEKYLIAYCHSRQEERVFRLSRILQLSPVSDIENTKDMYFPIYKETTETGDAAEYSNDTPVYSAQAPRSSNHTDNRASESKPYKKGHRKSGKPSAKASSSSGDSLNAAEPKVPKHRPNRRTNNKKDTTDLPPKDTGQKALFDNTSRQQQKRAAHSPKHNNQQFLPGFSDNHSSNAETKALPQERTETPDKTPRLPGL